MRIRNLLPAAALLGGLVAFGVPAGATTLALPNGTQTIYDVATGGMEFHHDHDSPYELAFEEPTVFRNDVDGGSIYEFTIPNFYDPLPRKDLVIELYGGNGGATADDFAYVLDIIGSDSPYGEIGPSQPVFGQLLLARDAATPDPLRYEEWVMYPNPDWEVVKIWAPIEFELVKIQITTQSVPEPAGAVLLGTGLLALLGIRRRR